MPSYFLTRLLPFLSIITLFALAAMPLRAEETGNSAWILNSSTLLSGPGAHYPDTSHTVTEGQAVVVSRCAMRWCKIANINGWLSIDSLSFGQNAKGPFSGPKFDTGRGGDGKVCFYDGINYSGNSVCLPSGAVARDLVLLGWDNRIASVSVDEGVSVNLCRDPNFSSLCILVDQSTARLERLLYNAASSWQVW